MSMAGKKGYQETSIGRIPNDWKLLKLADIADVNPGRTKPDDEDTEVTFLAMADVSENGAILKRQRRSYKDVAKGFTSFAENDVLVAKITPCFENGKGALVTGLIGGVGFGSTEFHVIRAKHGLSIPAFIKLHISSTTFRRHGERSMVGSAGQKRVPTEFIRQYQVAGPPLLEQQKIAAILTAVNDKLNVIAQQIDATHTLKQGLMQTLFRQGIGTQDATGHWVPHLLFKKCGTASYPNSWKMVSFENVAPIVRRPVKIEADAFYPELGLRSFAKGTFHKPALSGMEVGNKRLFKIQPGDLLFSNVFAWEGSVAVARKEDEGRFGSHRYITCKVDNRLANTSFLFRYITTPDGIELLKLASPGGAGRNRTLGLSALAAISIPLPPLDEQDKITEILDGVDAKLCLLIAKKKHYQTLKRGLMQKLLTGEWRVKLDDDTLTD